VGQDLQQLLSSFCGLLCGAPPQGRSLSKDRTLPSNTDERLLSSFCHFANQAPCHSWSSGGRKMAHSSCRAARVHRMFLACATECARLTLRPLWAVRRMRNGMPAAHTVRAKRPAGSAAPERCGAPAPGVRLLACALGGRRVCCDKHPSGRMSGHAPYMRGFDESMKCAMYLEGCG